MRFPRSLPIRSRPAKGRHARQDAPASWSRDRGLIRPRRAVPLLVLGAFALVGCGQNMNDQPKYQDYSQSTFFKDGASFRPLLPGTVARGQLRADSLKFAGKTADGKWTEELPAPITENTLRRGQERYNIYCSPCHGATGDGRGMIVRRGLSPPPSFHLDRLRQAPVGHYFDVITNGYGAMYPYGYRVQVDDRWAIIAYIRALQLHENVKADSLPSEIRARLEAPK